MFKIRYLFIYSEYPLPAYLGVQLLFNKLHQVSKTLEGNKVLVSGFPESAEQLSLWQ